MRLNTILTGLCATALFAVAGTAQAALVSCPADFTANGTAKVRGAATTNTAASACQYITPADNSNVASIANINAAGFFGFSDWQSNGQDQIEPAGGASGNWSITGASFASYDYIIVFKDGKNTNLIAFSLNELYSSGTWLTPFTDPPFDTDGAKDVSHYTIARRRTGDQQLPEPGTIALLGLGLLGLSVASRRRIA